MDEQFEQLYTELKTTTTQTETLLVVRKWLNPPENKDLRYTTLNYFAKTLRMRIDRYPREWLRSNRKKFNKNFDKYTIMDSCFLCEFPIDSIADGFARHHIIPLSRWGTNRPLNIVTLCNKCHAYFHPWLFPKTKPKVNVPNLMLNESLVFKLRLSDEIVADISIFAYKDK